jgi:hypothetical protein
MAMRKTRLRLVVLVCVIVGAVCVPVLLGALDPGEGTQTTGNVTLQTNSGPNVTVAGGREINLTDPFVDNNTLQVDTVDGNVTFRSPGRTHATITTINGTWTNLTRVGRVRKGLGGPLSVNVEDKSNISIFGSGLAGIGGGVAFDECTFNCSYAFTDVDETDTAPDIRYNRSVGGGTGFEVTGLQPDTEVIIVDDAGSDVLDIVRTTDGDGNVTFSGLPNGTHLTFVQSQFGAPVLSNATPTGDLSQPPSNLSVDVDDPNFDASTQVDVEIQLDGSTVTTTTLTDAGTVDPAVPSRGTDPGSHTWTVEATDAFGETTTESYSYRVPDGITVRNESNASQVITQAVNLTIFAGEQVFNRSTTNGQVNLTGLPTDEPLFIEARSSGFFDRTVYVTDIYQQQDLYLLNKSVSSIESRFVLSDPTGQFDSQSVLVIKKPIALNGSTRFETIYGDAFGSEGVTVDLESETRYNLVLRTRDGVVQDVGPYRSDVAETVTVQPGSPAIEVAEGAATWSTEAAIIQNSTGAYKIEFAYNDTESLTNSLEVFVHEKNNRSNQLGANRSYGAVSDLTGRYNLTDDQSEKTWVVEFTVERDDETYTPTEEVARLQDLTGGLDPLWQSVIGIGILLLSAGLFSALNAGVGGVVVSIEAGVLWWTGWLTGPTTGAGIVIAIFVAVLMHLYQRR